MLSPTSILGSSLNIAQKLAVKASVSKLKVNENNKNIRFWGKISGSGRDYLILVGGTATDSITKTFYFSYDEGVTFAKLPAADDFASEKARTVRTMFTGNPSFIYKDPAVVTDEDAEEEEEEDEEAAAAKAADPSKRKLNELERLAYTVAAIDNDTCVVPKGYCFLTPTGVITKNTAFAGLNSAQSVDLRNYVLYRDPRDPKTLARIRKLGVSNNFEFLDSVEQTHPTGALVVQTDDSGSFVSVRSLVWPGFEFQLEADSPNNFVGGYFGTGLKNDDVLFML